MNCSWRIAQISLQSSGRHRITVEGAH